MTFAMSLKIVSASEADWLRYVPGQLLLGIFAAIDKMAEGLLTAARLNTPTHLLSGPAQTLHTMTLLPVCLVLPFVLPFVLPSSSQAGRKPARSKVPPARDDIR